MEIIIILGFIISLFCIIRNLTIKMTEYGSIMTTKNKKLEIEHHNTQHQIEKRKAYQAQAQEQRQKQAEEERKLAEQRAKEERKLAEQKAEEQRKADEERRRLEQIESEKRRKVSEWENWKRKESAEIEDLFKYKGTITLNQKFNIMHKKLIEGKSPEEKAHIRGILHKHEDEIYAMVIDEFLQQDLQSAELGLSVLSKIVKSNTCNQALNLLQNKANLRQILLERGLPLNNPLITQLSTFVEIGEIIYFSGYDWRVLDVQDNQALILSELVLETRSYNEKTKDITWEECSLRRYLNNDFYNKLHDKQKIAQ